MLRSVLIFCISALFLGLGIGRFAFSPLIPELVEKGWLDVASAQAIGAANLIGYFAGALICRPALRLISERNLCILSGAVIPLSYCMFLIPFGIGWLWLARFLAGVGGGLLMVAAMAAGSRQLTLLNRTQFLPGLFVGIGIGALFAALCLPWLLTFGIEASILGLMLLSTGGLALQWKTGGFLSSYRNSWRPSKKRVFGFGWGVGLLILAYGCDALGFVMHTVYLPDMLRRSHGYTESQVGVIWAFFAVGACLGPVFVILLRRRLSALNALWIAFAMKAAGASLAFCASYPLMASLSLFIVGLLTPGLVILTSTALLAVSSPDRYPGLWASATALFALCQMVSGMVTAANSAEGYDTSMTMSVMILVVGALLTIAAKYVLKCKVRQ